MLAVVAAGRHRLRICHRQFDDDVTVAESREHTRCIEIETLVGENRTAVLEMHVGRERSGCDSSAHERKHYDN